MKNRDEELIDFPNPFEHANTSDSTAVSHEILTYFRTNHTAYGVYVFAIAGHGKGVTRKQMKERWRISDKRLDKAIDDINKYFNNQESKS